MAAPPSLTMLRLSQFTPSSELRIGFRKLALKCPRIASSQHISIRLGYHRVLNPCLQHNRCKALDEGDQGNESDDWDIFDAAQDPGDEGGIQENEAQDVETSSTADIGSPSIDDHSLEEYYVGIKPQVIEQQTHISEIWRLGLGGVLALAALAGLAFLGHRLFKDQAPKVQKAMEQRQLARESQQRLSEFMAQLRNQTTADLSAKNLGDDGFAYIVDSLSFNERCVAADFSKNGIGAAGVAQLAQALSTNTTIQSLVLDTNAVGDEGAVALATALAGGSRVKTLNLSGNNVGDAGAKALAEMLKSNTTLETLELNGNVIDYEGVAALADALTQNDSLKVLGLR